LTSISLLAAGEESITISQEIYDHERKKTVPDTEDLGKLILNSIHPGYSGATSNPEKATGRKPKIADEDQWIPRNQPNSIKHL
jgi:hypothetical protein